MLSRIGPDQPSDDTPSSFRDCPDGLARKSLAYYHRTQDTETSQMGTN